MRRLLTRAALAVGLCAALSPDCLAVDFRSEVRPILSDRCYTCHGPDSGTRMSPLRLDTREGVFAEASNGRPTAAS